MNQITVEQLSDDQKKKLKIPSVPQNISGWAVWECAPSTFDWHYDSPEKAYLYEGQVKVKTKDGDVTFGAGDFVTFPQGLSCSWQVLKHVRKVYRFN